jgi:peptide methionine sulfoxide reductase msrA/msrB
MTRTRPLIIILIVAAILGAVSTYFAMRENRYDRPATINPISPGIKSAYFSGGCFWCTEADFEKLTGVKEVISGYSGGHTVDPTYEEVVTETTGHRETVEVRYDPALVSYRTLVEYFFAHIDPVDDGGQFVDRGESYTSAIFYMNDEERSVIEDEIKRLETTGAFSEPIATAVLPFSKFYPAEEYHQDYHAKNPIRYNYYRNGSGRDKRLKEICEIRVEKYAPCSKAEDVNSPKLPEPLIPPLRPKI